MNHNKSAIVAILIAVFASGCGGGGSAEPSKPAPAPAPAPAPGQVVTPADLQTVVAPFTYPAGSAELAFATAFNEFRSKVGLGLLAQSTLLDKAAQAHLQYVLYNDVLNGGTVNMRTNDPVSGRSMFHIEQPGLNYFTGVQEIDRAKAAGYTGAYVGEQLSFGGGQGADAAFSALVATIYHRAGLMLQAPRDIGIAVGQDRSQTFTVEVGHITPQRNAGDFVGTYPANNQTGVGLHTGVETPNPFPDLSTANDDFPTKTGYPISVVVAEGKTLEVGSFTVSEAGAISPLPTRMLTKATDPNKYLSGNIAFLVATAPFKSNTQYTVSFAGRVDGGAINKTWSFTTKP